MSPSKATLTQAPGILPSQELRQAIADGVIGSADQIAIGEAQVQPASLDLRLGRTAYRVRASFLPGEERSVAQKLADFQMYEVDLRHGAIFERNCVYIVPLLESLHLPPGMQAFANPKSSTGRLDIFARLITDHGTAFDRVREGYQGPLWAEICPHAFSIAAHAGSRLLQLRLQRGEAAWNDHAMRRLHAASPLVDGDLQAEKIERGVPFSIDALGATRNGLVGFKARRNAPIIDVNKIAAYDPFDFWDPIRARAGEGIILDPDDFYILASKESVVVPDDHAAEMLPYDISAGEFRVHYAGFFDPGFGMAETGGAGSKAVLEVRSRDVPFMVEDGQIVGRLVYQPLTTKPDKLYGTPIGSSYQSQGLALGKQFKPYTHG